MIGDQFVGADLEALGILILESRQQAEVAAGLGVDDHAAGEAKRRKNVGQNVHRHPDHAYECGVSVKLSGKLVILANRRLK
ncbi:hypothetical protein [Sphingomonas daechungensis]|uniref:hypothetical protein n=1 Tax=Sphingomonas daechungensis TaxID=1176646 RepID=UPI001CB94666|nr:hypothetical protein [Sphingomonas daechungensis]